MTFRRWPRRKRTAGSTRRDRSQFRARSKARSRPNATSMCSSSSARKVTSSRRGAGRAVRLPGGRVSDGVRFRPQNHRFGGRNKSLTGPTPRGYILRRRRHLLHRAHRRERPGRGQLWLSLVVSRRSLRSRVIVERVTYFNRRSTVTHLRTPGVLRVCTPRDARYNSVGGGELPLFPPSHLQGDDMPHPNSVRPVHEGLSARLHSRRARRADATRL